MRSPRGHGAGNSSLQARISFSFPAPRSRSYIYTVDHITETGIPSRAFRCGRRPASATRCIRAPIGYGEAARVVPRLVQLGCRMIHRCTNQSTRRETLQRRCAARAGRQAVFWTKLASTVVYTTLIKHYSRSLQQIPLPSKNERFASEKSARISLGTIVPQTGVYGNFTVRDPSFS